MTGHAPVARAWRAPGPIVGEPDDAAWPRGHGPEHGVRLRVGVADHAERSHRLPALATLLALLACAGLIALMDADAATRSERPAPSPMAQARPVPAQPGAIVRP